MEAKVERMEVKTTNLTVGDERRNFSHERGDE
jgi:hypothetical protein